MPGSFAAFSALLPANATRMMTGRKDSFEIRTESPWSRVPPNRTSQGCFDKNI
jgi:hypothetical protein